jgi:hypothetical protein
MENTKDFYSELAIAIQWFKDTNENFIDQAEENIKTLEKLLPYGSGFDNGSKVNLKESNGQKIVINTSFHHMDENGCYDGWTEHTIIITPCLMYGYKIRITGKNRNYVKDYIYQQFDNIIV